MVKTILVTGSTGWLGGKLCEALVARGVKVWGLARRVTHVAGVMSVRADLATGAGLEKLQGLEFDCCVHLGAVAGWGALADCLEVNVQGTRRLFCLAALKEFKAGVRQMNVTAEHAFIKDGCTVPQVMRTIYGDAVAHIDFSHYERPGHERDALYDNSLVREELGFKPKVNILTDYNK